MDGSGEANPYIDSSVGALVWVRRRNGSWWPGRILGPEELPGSHLLSPRTGTPVKLLGREDGSVDWYNIEKSRRVKAFRCGDFDECIEKAKSLASVLTKKREKYARREDAILHALELEKKYIQQNYSLERRLSLDRSYREMSNFVDDDMVLDDDMEGIPNHSDFQSEFMDPESSADAAQASLDSLFSLQGERKFLDADWEDEIVETIPRMRGLQDLGLKIASSKERKSSRSIAYEHAADVSLPDEEHKLASCMTKSAAMLPCTAVAISKRKRSSQTGWAEDESAYKKQEWQMPLAQGLDNRVKFEEGATDLGSKAPLAPFLVSTSRNGFGLLPPKQEKGSAILGNTLQGPSEWKPSTAGSGPELWQAEAKLHDTSLIIDKACSSFSDPMKINCCDGRSYPYAGSQMGLAPSTGPPFVDSHIPGGTPLRCSFFPRSSYTASATNVNDNGIQTVSSFGLAEKLTGSLPNFHLWPYYGHREALLPNEFGLAGQIASGRAVGLPEYSFETTVPSPMYPLYSNPLESSSAFVRSGALEKEGALLLPRNVANGDATKAPVKSCKQCLSAGAEEADRRFRAREDEADSLQMNQESTTCSFKDVGALGDEGGGLKQAEGFKAAIRPSDPNGAGNTHGFTRTDALLDDTSLHYVTSPSNESSDLDIQQRWQAKGKRRSRIPCRSNWVLPAAGTLADMTPANPVVDEDEHVPDANPNDVKNRTTRGHNYLFDFDFSSEEEPLKDSVRSRQQPACKPRVCFESSYDAVKVHNGSSWFEVMVEDQITAVIQDQFVSLVSIMSKLKGRPIVGHPVLVERMERIYGGSQTGGSRSYAHGFDAIKPPLQPVWRTARRTAMLRVPRSCGIVISRDYALKRQQKQMHSTAQNRLMTKSSSLLRSFADRRKAPKKPVPVPQKTRMLSSISVQDADKVVEPAASKVVAPAVATCIPVNVIFNRIREVLYRGTNYAASDSDVS